MKSLLALVWGFLNTVLRGYLVKTFWVWFVVSQFPGLPTISTAAGIGFSFMVSALTPWKGLTTEDFDKHSKQTSEEKESLAFLNAGAYSLIILFSLFFGWILHHFFM